MYPIGTTCEVRRLAQSSQYSVRAGRSQLSPFRPVGYVNDVRIDVTCRAHTHMSWSVILEGLQLYPDVDTVKAKLGAQSQASYRLPRTGRDCRLDRVYFMNRVTQRKKEMGPIVNPPTRPNTKKQEPFSRPPHAGVLEQDLGEDIHECNAPISRVMASLQNKQSAARSVADQKETKRSSQGAIQSAVLGPLVLTTDLILLLGGEIVLDVERLSDLVGGLALDHVGDGLAADVEEGLDVKVVCSL